MPKYDVIVAGGGPAGSACATVCAAAGWQTLVLERSLFPREKVCGDCLNPACWPILERMNLSTRVRELPHAVLECVQFAAADEETLHYPLPGGACPEIAVKRSHLDALLLQRAAECGAETRDGATVSGVQRQTNGGWRIQTNAGEFESRWLVAADGRNSTVGRILGLLPASRMDRVGLQMHFPLPAETSGQVTMRFLPAGYCGLADIGDGLANLCLVSGPRQIGKLKAWAVERYGLSEWQTWRTISPLSRGAVAPVHEGLLLTGDAARVVEPFTGEGIYYALASGELAAQHLLAGDPSGYARAHAELYRGRLWINRLARFACTHPGFASLVLRGARCRPEVLGAVTRMVVGPGGGAPR